ncbi:MAG TPA: hypothetical protein VG650_10420 [Mycobacteriales bacterium]|nr:hypothetical protein [Mycobacteriales bacterium]
MRRWLAALAGGVTLAGGLVAATTATAAPLRAEASRPAAEHVPTSVDYVRIAFRDTSDSSNNRTVVLHGTRAHHLVKLFDALKREPRGTVHCDAMTTSHTSVTFRGTSHTWVATEALCTNVTVERDGEALPTLLESNKWNDALTRYIGHSPTAAGSSTPSS